MERIVLYVEAHRPDSAAIGWALDLARRLGARVFAAFVVDPSGLPDGPEREPALSEAEEAAWKILYEIEDEAFEQNIKISLILDQGDPTSRLVEIADSYEGQLVVASGDTALPHDELLTRSPVPVVFVNEPKEVS